MKVAVQSMAHLYQQCDLWASRSKMNEGKKAMMDCRAECILLMRFIECSQLMLITDKHPEGKLSKEDKEQCKANLDSALRRLEVAKPRLKQHLLQLYKEQLRRAAAANTTALGDALEGKKSTGNTSTSSSTPTTVVGDALMQEMLAAAGASKASQKPPPAHSFSGGLHPMHLPQPSSGSNGVGGAGEAWREGSGLGGWMRVLTRPNKGRSRSRRTQRLPAHFSSNSIWISTQTKQQIFRCITQHL